MAAAVLAGVGFQATSLGTSIPAQSLAAAIKRVRPSLFWLSVATFHLPQRSPKTAVQLQIAAPLLALNLLSGDEP